MIRFLTITGADDSVNPDTLIELSKTYPFVEWGILVSAKRYGTPRFPSKAWLAALENGLMNASGINLSLHVCGSYVREFMNGSPTAGEFVRDLGLSLWREFKRVQLNTHGEPHQVNLQPVYNFFNANKEKEFILQLDEVNENLFQTLVASKVSNVSGLFDKSHGAGVSPTAWPSPYMFGPSFGYAGGLGPDNLASQINDIRLALTAPPFETPDFWLDMETKVRSGNDILFDTNKVIKALNIAAPWFTRIASALHDNKRQVGNYKTVGEEMTKGKAAVPLTGDDL